MTREDSKFKDTGEIFFWCLIASLYMDCSVPLFIDGFCVASTIGVVCLVTLVTCVLRIWVYPHKKRIQDFLGRMFSKGLR